MSELLDMIKTRRSIRKYKSDMVPKEIIDKIVEAGTYAATGMGQQSPIILAVTNKEVRDKLSKWNADIMGQTPTILWSTCCIGCLSRQKPSNSSL